MMRFAAARRAGTGRRPHAPRERLRLHPDRVPRGARGAALNRGMEILNTSAPEAAVRHQAGQLNADAAIVASPRACSLLALGTH